jgi:predicted ester cyclase
MLTLAVHQTPSLTRERYEEVVRRLTGKTRIESPSDLPFDGLLVDAAGQGPNGFCVFDVFESEEAVEASETPSAQSPKKSGSKSLLTSSPPTRRWLLGLIASNSDPGCDETALGSVGRRADPLAEPKEKAMDRTEMLRHFEAHREAEAARDIDAILETFVSQCFLETVPLGLRSDGRDAFRAAYEQQFFTAFPDLAPEDEGIAVGDDVVAVWGTLRGTSRGEWLGIPPGGGMFAVPFANVVPFSQGLMAGERIYFDLATLCEQARLPLEQVRAAAAARRPTPATSSP